MWVRLFLVLVSLLSLLALGRLAAGWAEVARVTGEVPGPPSARGFDWVQWQDHDGDIVAAYVYPGGTAYAAGLREGATLYQLEMQQFFSADDVARAVEGIAPGNVLLYDVVQDDAPASIEIEVTPYPTLLYPLSGALWQASAWGFGVAAFLHLLGLVIVAPLAWRSRRARRSFWLFAAASVWVFGTLVRLLSITLFGPPMGGAYAAFLGGVTLAALGGWVLFPALLLHVVVSDAPRLLSRAGALRWVVFLPPAVLGALVALTAALGAVGPVTLEALVGPILFYVCVFVAAATGLTLLLPSPPPSPEGDDVPAASAWSRAGSAAVFLIAALGALSVYGIVPLPGAVSDATVGWLIVAVQLLSLPPVGLVSLATLRHGRAEAVLTRALGWVALLGATFFVVVGGLAVIERLAPAGLRGWPHAVVAGLYVVALLVVAERLAQPMRRYAAGLFATERQRAAARLRALGEAMRLQLDAERLAAETVEAVGEALGAGSAVLFLRHPASARWIRASYRPEPPYFTEAELGHVWHDLRRAGAVWARNPELNETRLTEAQARQLRRRGVALAVPVAGGEAEPAGLLVLGRKVRRRAVYNLEDVAMLRALCGQLALARERLALVEREKALVRESAEAQLVALRAQINPHFLFNALNTIAALIAEKPDEAEQTVERLAGIFRHILRTGSRTFVPLGEELALVDDYLAIEQARFGEKLRVRHRHDLRLMELPVPAFAVQTLVENAVKHGIERKRGGGRLTLGSRRADGLAEITVADTGVGIPALFGPEGEGGADFFGLGLRNVAARLERLYGRHDLLRLESAPEAGTVARLLIPIDGVIT